MKRKLMVLCCSSAMLFAPAIFASSHKRSSERTATSDKNSAQTLDLNTASAKDLESLPGVGRATAQKIIAGRPYSSVTDLSRAGVPQSTIEKITPMVTVSAGQAAAQPATQPAGQSVGQAAGQAAAQPKVSSRESNRSGETGEAERSIHPNGGDTAEAGPPPAPGMVWVNTKTKVFHEPGDPFYGKTKHGKYMTQADALKAGYRQAK